MRKIVRLKHEALASCTGRGHKLTKFTTIHSHAAVANCIICYKSVWVRDQPQPNQIDIHGGAVAENCIDALHWPGTVDQFSSER